jgi:hypothetical protein
MRNIIQNLGGAISEEKEQLSGMMRTWENSIKINVK